MNTFKIGIDIGGTTSSFGVVNEYGQILNRGEINTRGHGSVEAFVQTIHEFYINNVEPEVRAAISALGIGAPNGNYYTGNVEFAPNLEWKGVIPMAHLFESVFKLPTKLTNDANAAAMGEMKYGATKGMKDFIMITLGTGVGSGFVCNGQLVYGHDGFAGELGHVISVRDGRLCGCGRYGCLETYTSATGIVRTAHEFLDTRKGFSLLRQKIGITSHDIFLSATAGDELAIEIFEYTGKILGQSLADAVAITSPEAIVLFGGLAQAGSFIFEPTKKHMEANLLSIFKNKVKLIPSLLHESDAAILGAAALH